MLRITKRSPNILNFVKVWKKGGKYRIRELFFNCLILYKEEILTDVEKKMDAKRPRILVYIYILQIMISSQFPPDYTMGIKLPALMNTFLEIQFFFTLFEANLVLYFFFFYSKWIVFFILFLAFQNQEILNHSIIILQWFVTSKSESSLSSPKIASRCSES